jgi:pimeloyl-ACP methyl ester carboxylesterase
LKKLLLTPFLTLERRLTFKPTREDYGALPARHERITFGTEFGLSLHGEYVERGSGPVALFIHGNRYNLTRFKAQYDLFARLGLSFFTFDYPGYGESEGKPSEAATYAAARAAYSYLTRSRAVEPSRILVYGLSLGAAVSAELLISNPARAFVAECPFTNSWDMAKHLYPHLPIWWLFPNRYRNDQKFALLKLPLFIIHGYNDRITPHAASERLYRSYTASKQIALVEGAGHNDCLECGGPQLWEQLRAFIRSSFGDLAGSL